MDKINDFLKHIVAGSSLFIVAEQEYAKALIKASKPIKEDYMKKMNDKSKLWKALAETYIEANSVQITRHGHIY